MELINMTPHPINVCDNTGKTVEVINPSGMIARIKERKEQFGFLNDVPLFKKSYGDVENLPDASPTRIYICSSQIVELLRGVRADVVAPDDFVRDTDGRIIGCKTFWFA